MGRSKTMLISCAHCGRWMLLRTTKPRKTKPYIGVVDNFKTAPKGWTYTGGPNRDDILCPECIEKINREWQKFITPCRLSVQGGSRCRRRKV